MSQVEILTALFYGGVMRFERGNADVGWRDRIIISKGHATMGLYPIFSDLGYFDQNELDLFCSREGMLRLFGNTSIPGIDATSGSLGHGLGIGVGFAIASKHDELDNRVFVIISEGEMYEGSIWESALLAAHRELDNLVIILDRNHKIILGDTEELVRLEPIAEKWKAFGFHTVTVDGHSFPELLEAFGQIGSTKGKPLMVVANTVKGKGIPMMEGEVAWHYFHDFDEDTKAQIHRDLVHNEASYQ
jgi:transketolase